jgi:hypothetical protein
MFRSKAALELEELCLDVAEKIRTSSRYAVSSERDVAS